MEPSAAFLWRQDKLRPHVWFIFFCFFLRTETKHPCLPTLCFQHDPPEGKCLNPQLFVPPLYVGTPASIFVFTSCFCSGQGGVRRVHQSWARLPRRSFCAYFKRAARVQRIRRGEKKKKKSWETSNEPKQDAAALGRVEVQACIIIQALFFSTTRPPWFLFDVFTCYFMLYLLYLCCFHSCTMSHNKPFAHKAKTGQSLDRRVHNGF